MLEVSLPPFIVEKLKKYITKIITWYDKLHRDLIHVGKQDVSCLEGEPYLSFAST